MIKIVKTTSVLGNRKSITFQKPNIQEINIIKQNAGIMPNITHTLDAANIALVVVDSLIILNNISSNYKLELISIHDCFSSHANHSEMLIQQVKLAFIKLYADINFVNNYHKFILNYIKNSGFNVDTHTNKVSIQNNEIEIPNIPEFKSDFDLRSNLLGSKYFII